MDATEEDPDIAFVSIIPSYCGFKTEHYCKASFLQIFGSEILGIKKEKNILIIGNDPTGFYDIPSFFMFRNKIFRFPNIHVDFKPSTPNLIIFHLYQSLKEKVNSNTLVFFFLFGVGANDYNYHPFFEIIEKLNIKKFRFIIDQSYSGIAIRQFPQRFLDKDFLLLCSTKENEKQNPIIFNDNELTNAFFSEFIAETFLYPHPDGIKPSRIKEFFIHHMILILPQTTVLFFQHQFGKSQLIKHQKKFSKLL